MMAVQYETKATNVGGRKGHVHTDDNAINVDVLPPQQADGNATNPEQLFAAGYSNVTYIYSNDYIYSCLFHFCYDFIYTLESYD